MSVILVIQPDAAQARVLHDMCRRIGAEMVDVESTKQAVNAIARRLPDLILLSAFLSPRDEDTLMSHLRSHEGASHLQTMTIPQFRTGDESKSKKSGFGFGKKKKAAVAVGADPAAFADEVVSLLHRASEIRNRPAPAEPVRSVIAPEPEPEPVASVLIDDAAEPEPVFMNSLVDDSLFVDSAESTESTESALAEYAAEPIEPAIADERFIEEPLIEEPAVEERVFDQPVMAAAVASEGNRGRSITEEIDQLVRQLGLDVKLGSTHDAPFAAQVEAVSTNIADDDFDLGASLERARNKAILRTDEAPPMHPDAEAIRESAMAEARAMAQREAREAREASAAEMARVQAEAQAVRVAAEARAAAEREAREALTAEHERKRQEAEQKAAAEREAREALAADLERKRQAAEEKAAAERQAREAAAAEFERKRQAAEQKAAAERQAREALAAELELKRQAAEAQAAAERQKREALAADLERARTEAEQKRLASIAEARAAAEREAREKLEADMARAQAEAEEKRHAAEEKRRAAEATAAAERQAREALAADLARAQAEAEQVREAAIAEARAAAEKEARDALAADLARVQVEAEQMRQRAMAEARETAEREARETLAVEVERARSEAQSTFTDALNKVKVEAEEADRKRVEAERFNEEAKQAFARELLRVRHEVEQSLTAQLDAARAESDRIRTAEAEAVRERAAVEAQLKAELDRLRFVTTQARKADESETKKASQQIKQLEAELASVRAKAEERKHNELEELRAQMAEMREAAAQHARAAAADAVAAAVAAAAPRTTAVVTQFPTREVARVDHAHHEEETSERSSRDYLSLWQPKKTSEPEVAEETADADEDEREPFVTAANMRRHAKWALPVAACLLLVTNTGTAIDTVSKLFATEEKKPVAVVQPAEEPPPFFEVVEKRVGKLELSSTPAGAEAIVDGKSYGKTPLTIPDLDAGLHTLQLKSQSGTITRKVTIKVNQTTVLAEAIYSGWLAIFSQIPVKVIVDGAAVSLTEDGRVMASPGTHVVQFINEQFNYRVTEKLEVRPGETTAHTLTLPMGTVRVTAPEGTMILVDGQPANGSPGEGLPVAIGSHEISGRHPDHGERKMPVDVKHGGLTEITIRFD